MIKIWYRIKFQNFLNLILIDFFIKNKVYSPKIATIHELKVKIKENTHIVWTTQYAFFEFSSLHLLSNIWFRTPINFKNCNNSTNSKTLFFNLELKNSSYPNKHQRQNHSKCAHIFSAHPIHHVYKFQLRFERIIQSFIYNRRDSFARVKLPRERNS